MAIYVPDSTRRRRLVVIAVVCLIGGLTVGSVAGRATAPDLDSRVRQVRSQAQDAANALGRMPIEYQQAVTDTGESTATITDALERARALLDAAYAEIDVFGPASRAATDDAFDELAAAIVDEVDPAQFDGAITRAITAINATFGLSSG